MIEFENRNGVALITFDNGRLNIMTREFHHLFYRALMRFLNDDTLKVAILTNPPNTSFSAGDDLKTVDLPFVDEPDWSEITLLTPRNKPIIAAVRGHCIGQGLIHLLLMTDIRFASPGASFGFPEIRYGMGGAAIVGRLYQAIPPVVASRLALTGEMIDARSAVACFLVNEVVSDETLLEVALAEAEKIAAHPLGGLKLEVAAWGRMGTLGRTEVAAIMSDFWDHRSAQ